MYVDDWKPFTVTELSQHFGLYVLQWLSLSLRVRAQTIWGPTVSTQVVSEEALSNEDPDSQGMCGLLARHMYGTRGAADGWQ